MVRVLVVSSDRSYALGLPANLGDALLTDAMCGYLTALGHDVEAADFGGTRRSDKSERRPLRGFRQLVAALGDYDAVLLGGGTLIQEDRNRRIVGGLARLCCAVRVAAWLRRRPVAYFGVGVDPLTRRSTRLLYWVATRRAAVWLRDERSVSRFRRYFGGRPDLAADAALLMQPFPSAERNVESTVVLAPNRRDAPQLDLALIDKIRAAGRRPIVLSMSQTPGAADHDTLPRETLNAASVAADLGWTDAVRILSSSRAVVASRMHGLYVALLAGVPMVAVGDEPKIHAFAAEFGVPLVPKFSCYELGMERSAATDATATAAARAREAALDLHRWLELPT